MTVLDDQRMAGRRVTGPTVLREARGRVPGDGIELAYGFWPGAGQPIIALHGVTASYVNFVGIAERLACRRPFLAFDLRGRGDSDKPESGPFGMAQHADDVAAAMSAFELSGCIVVGHSMGAFVAVALADRYPDLVAGMVLVDGGLPLDPPADIAPEQLLDVALAPQMARLRTTFESFDAYLEFWRELPPFQGGRWNSWVEAYLRYDLGGEAPAFRPKASEACVRGDFLDTLNRAELRRRVRAISVPTRLLRAPEGFNPGQPPLLPDDLVRRELAGLTTVTDLLVEDTTHYTIGLGERGAAVVADTIVELAEECGR